MQKETYQNGILIETVAFSEAEIAVIKALQDKAKRNAYSIEADPLFFKWQREEGTKQDWLDKVAEIQLRFIDMA